ncbi:MAG: 3-phosphoshikimate 1-carboxyvinyltransferase [Acidimicrobiales bacterium]
MSTFVARPAPAGVRGRIRVPGDKSISHRAVLLAARAEGCSRIRGLSGGDDVRHTLDAVEHFGAGVERRGREIRVDGGTARLHEPGRVVDVGNSGTGIRLLAGWAACVDGLTVLAGDDSIAYRPMARVVEPLRAMGAQVDGRDGGRLAPLVVRGGGLHGIDYVLPVASAQVKGAVLLAGVGADGETTVRESTPLRAHTEELLSLCGADVRWGAGAVSVRRSLLAPFDIEVPGDPSQAAFWVVAACVTPGSDLTVKSVYVGRGRAGFLDVLRRMGADVEVIAEDEASTTADLRARFSPLRGTDVGGDEVPSLIDEIPVLAVAAAYAEGVTTFSGAAELRHKESDRIVTMTTALGALGASTEGRVDGIVVRGRGGRPLEAAAVSSAGDHRVAMAMAVAALPASGPVAISGWEAVATSYPGFEEDYGRCVS